MKICFLTYNIFELGGIQRVVSVVANGLSNTHEIDILCTNSKYKIDRDLYKLNKNITVDINDSITNKNFIKKIIYKLLKIINRKTGILNNEKFYKILTEIYFPKTVQNNLIEYINSKEYDVVIGVAGELSLLLSIISNKIKSKTIGWQHNSYDAYFNNKGRYFWNQDELFKKYLKNLDEYIVLTNEDKKLISNNLNINAIRIYNPLSFKSEEKSPCKDKNILFMGRLQEQQKGLDLLIDLFKIVADKNKDWNLVIVGDGPDKEKIKERILKLNLEKRVSMKEFTNNVKEYYLKSSLFVSTSRWEGFGLVITEAMECGLPVVAFANSGPREIINNNGENGILVDCENIEMFAEKILYLINNPQILKKISENSIRRSKDFNIDNIVKEWEELILKIYEN